MNLNNARPFIPFVACKLIIFFTSLIFSFSFLWLEDFKWRNEMWDMRVKWMNWFWKEFKEKLLKPTMMSYRILTCCDTSSLNVVSGLPVFSAFKTIDSGLWDWYLSWTRTADKKIQLNALNFQFLSFYHHFVALHCSALQENLPEKKGWLASFKNWEHDEHACGMCNRIPHCVIYTPYNLIFSRKHRWLSINETGN